MFASGSSCIYLFRRMRRSGFCRKRVEILRGLLGADLIGMHTYDYTYNYLRSVRRILASSHMQARSGCATTMCEARHIH